MLTFIGIVVMLAVIVLWVVYENRRLWGHVARIRSRTERARRGHPRPIARTGRARGDERLAIEKQASDRVPAARRPTSKSFEIAMIVLSIICVIIVLIIVLATNIGNEFRPTV